MVSVSMNIVQSMHELTQDLQLRRGATWTPLRKMGRRMRNERGVGAGSVEQVGRSCVFEFGSSLHACECAETYTSEDLPVHSTNACEDEKKYTIQQHYGA